MGGWKGSNVLAVIVVVAEERDRGEQWVNKKTL